MPTSKRPPAGERAVPADWRSLPTAALLDRLGAAAGGLAGREAASRLARFGPNEVARHRRSTLLRELAGLFLNPLVVLLLVAALVAAVLGEPANAGIIAVIVAINVGLNAVQAHHSQRAVDALRRQVALTATAVRDGVAAEIPRGEVVPGDVLRLAAGNVVPADGRFLETRDLFVNEAVLTGESLPVAKAADDNALFGTSVMSGSAMLLAVVTGAGTEFGGIAERLAEREPENAFERGIRQFAFLVTRVAFALVLFVFLVNVVLERSPLESLLFALALAVGITPELLPMVTSVTLARGAVRMAQRRVVVKRLPAIQNLGSMDVLCSDKTGTLTAGAVALGAGVDPLGAAADAPLRLASLNSAFEAGIRSPLDAVILAARSPDPDYAKLDEIPFDFVRRRLSVAVAGPDPDERSLITKGAPESVLAVCATYRVGAETRPLAPDRAAVVATFERLSRDGYRTLAVATKPLPAAPRYGAADEADLCLVGFLAFVDPPKPDAGAAIRDLAADGVRLVVLTGDNELVAGHICREIGLDPGAIVLGPDLDRTSDPALGALVERTTVFARVSPAQKTRVIGALRGRGHVVGFLGDGVNDAPSLQAADVGISVANAAEVAREAADIILLEPDLRVLHDGVLEGRRSFGNVMKYLLMGISSNFGNMLSMAGAALVLPFLPLLPLQVLLNNLLYDASQTALPLDAVDPAFVRKPRHWDVGFIARFMAVFGPISSLFDFLTFGVMLRVFQAGESLFHTGWFMESLATQTLVVYVIRTAGSPLRSRPSRALVVGTLLSVAIGVALPFTPLAPVLGFVRPPAPFFVFLVAVIVAYLALAQAVKRWFYRRYRFVDEGTDA